MKGGGVAVVMVYGSALAGRFFGAAGCESRAATEPPFLLPSFLLSLFPCVGGAVGGGRFCCRYGAAAWAV